jgi:hypothetical protein
VEATDPGYKASVEQMRITLTIKRQRAKVDRLYESVMREELILAALILAHPNCDVRE